jgi:hypothetical protein
MTLAGSETTRFFTIFCIPETSRRGGRRGAVEFAAATAKRARCRVPTENGTRVSDTFSHA